MSETGTVRRFTPPNTFRAKVPASGGIALEQMQAAADEALAQLQGQSQNWLQEDVTKLVDHLAAAAALEEPSGIAVHVKEISKVTHDLKALALQFEFPMINRIGQSLCDFIVGDPDLAVRRLDIVRVHVDAIVVVLANGLSGDGGSAGAHLIEALEKAVGKARAQHAAPGSV